MILFSIDARGSDAILGDCGGDLRTSEDQLGTQGAWQRAAAVRTSPIGRLTTTMTTDKALQGVFFARVELAACDVAVHDVVIRSFK